MREAKRALRLPRQFDMVMRGDMDEPILRHPAAIHALGIIGRDDRAVGADRDQPRADLVLGELGQDGVRRRLQREALIGCLLYTSRCV